METKWQRSVCISKVMMMSFDDNFFLLFFSCGHSWPWNCYFHILKLFLRKQQGRSVRKRSYTVSQNNVVNGMWIYLFFVAFLISGWFSSEKNCWCQITTWRVHNSILRSRFPTHFFQLIPPSCLFLPGNLDPANFSKMFLCELLIG